MKIDISQEEAEYLLDAVDIWANSREDLRNRLMGVAYPEPLKVENIQSAVDKTLNDPRVNELVSKGHSASAAITAVLSNNMGVEWKSPLNPLRNMTPAEIVEKDAKEAQKRHEERNK